METLALKLTLFRGDRLPLLLLLPWHNPLELLLVVLAGGQQVVHAHGRYQLGSGCVMSGSDAMVGEKESLPVIVESEEGKGISSEEGDSDVDGDEVVPSFVGDKKSAMSATSLLALLLG